MPTFSATKAYSALESNFRDLATKAGVKVKQGRVSALWQQGLFIAASGALAKPAKDGSRDVGLIHLVTPQDRALLTQDDVEVPPGDYVIHVTSTGAVALRAAGGNQTIPVAPPGTAKISTGGIFECSNPDGYTVDVDYNSCRISITLECPGQWVYLVAVFEIPFCNLLDGVFS